MRDFMVTHANLTWGARLWTFGAPSRPDDDGWRMEGGRISAGGGYLDLDWAGDEVVLVSPGDQVIRAGKVDRMVLGFPSEARLLQVHAYARIRPGGAWQPIASAGAGTLRHTAAGWVVPLSWPAGKKGDIYEAMRVVVKFPAGVTRARLERVALLPAASGQ
jgi:hypothetical protein